MRAEHESTDERTQTMRHFGLRLVALASHLHGNVESLLNRAWWALQSDEDREAARLYPEG